MSVELSTAAIGRIRDEAYVRAFGDSVPVTAADVMPAPAIEVPNVEVMAAPAAHHHQAKSNTAPLYLLALGTFAIGTEGFMIAGILPKIAGDLQVSVQTAGELMAIFALTYAISSPILTTLFGSLNRRRLLIGALGVFAAGNLLAAFAPNYEMLAAARVLLAISAGLYAPNATALAGALVHADHRGRALSIVTGGTSLAVALGVPLGAVLGSHLGWRSTFEGVALIAAIAVTGLVIGLPRNIGANLAAASLRDRLAVVRQPAALLALLVTTLWAMASYTVYTFVAPYAADVLGLSGSALSYVLFAWGAAAFLGIVAGGAATDRFGAKRWAAVMLPISAAALAGLSVFTNLTTGAALVPVLVAMAVWGFSGWGFFPAQQTRLIGITGPKGASVAISLNASFMYLGFSLGAQAGSLTLSHLGVAQLGYAGAAAMMAAFALFLGTRRH